MRIACVLVALLAVGCGKSKCETYADMEIRCGGYPKSEEDITRKLAQGMCATTGSTEPGLREISERIERQAACAVKHDGDCAAYKACSDAAEK